MQADRRTHPVGVPQGMGFSQKASAAEVAQVRGPGMGDDTGACGTPPEEFGFYAYRTGSL